MNAEIRPHFADPGPLVESVFSAVAIHAMGDLPLNNPALRVEAVGFTRWRDNWIGVLITPWTINLLLLPGGDPGFRVLRGGENQSWIFPNGEYEFQGGYHDSLGHYQSCSLFSPPAEFADQAGARQVAAEILPALLNEDGRAEPSTPPAVLSRRAFLNGRFTTAR